MKAGFDMYDSTDGEIFTIGRMAMKLIYTL